MTPYKTPIPDAPEDWVCREFTLPPDLWHVVWDYLGNLAREYQWEEDPDGLTVEQTIELIESAITALHDNECEDELSGFEEMVIEELAWMALEALL